MKLRSDKGILILTLNGEAAAVILKAPGYWKEKTFTDGSKEDCYIMSSDMVWDVRGGMQIHVWENYYLSRK